MKNKKKKKMMCKANSFLMNWVQRRVMDDSTLAREIRQLVLH